MALSSSSISFCACCCTLVPSAGVGAMPAGRPCCQSAAWESALKALWVSLCLFSTHFLAGRGVRPNAVENCIIGPQLVTKHFPKSLCAPCFGQVCSQRKHCVTADVTRRE